MIYLGAMAGCTLTADPFPADRDIIHTLDTMWVATLPGLGEGLAVDANDNVLVLPEFKDLERPIGGFCLASLGLDSETGSELWLTGFGAPEELSDPLRHCARKGQIQADLEGAHFIVGTDSYFADGDATYDMYLRKHDASGGELWSRYLDGEDQANDSGNSVATTPSGSVYIGGSQHSTSVDPLPWLVKLDGAGELQWELRDDNPSVSGALDVYAHGSDGVIAVATREQYRIARQYDGEGTLRSEYDLPSDYIFTMDPQGNAIVLEDNQLARYDTSGILLWRQDPVSPRFYAVTTGLDGHIYAGRFLFRGGDPSDKEIFKYTPDGQLLWQRHYPTNTRAEFDGLQVDSKGNILVLDRDVVTKLDGRD